MCVCDVTWTQRDTETNHVRSARMTRSVSVTLNWFLSVQPVTPFRPRVPLPLHRQSAGSSSITQPSQYRKSQSGCFWSFWLKLRNIHRYVSDQNIFSGCHVSCGLVAPPPTLLLLFLPSSADLHAPTLSSRLLPGNPDLTRGGVLPCKPGMRVASVWEGRFFYCFGIRGTPAVTLGCSSTLVYCPYVSSVCVSLPPQTVLLC